MKIIYGIIGILGSIVILVSLVSIIQFLFPIIAGVLGIVFGTAFIYNAYLYLTGQNDTGGDDDSTDKVRRIR